MNIGIISPFYHFRPLGGSVISVRLLSESLVGMGHEVTTYSFDDNRYLEEIVKGVNIKRFKKSSKLPNWSINLNRNTFKNLKNIVKSHDILHVYTTLQIPAVSKLGKKHNIPVVATLNNYGLICPDATMINKNHVCNGFGLFKCFQCIFSKYGSFNKEGIKNVYDYVFQTFYCRWALNYKNNVDRYIAVSDTVKLKHIENGVDIERIEVIPNMIDPKFLEFKPEDECNNTNKKIILFVGRLHRTKGVDILINSIPHIVKEYEDIEVWIVGYGKEKQKYECMIKDLKLDAYVKFLGEIKSEKLPSIYHKADIFVSPFVSPEPFARTMLEAMACKTPLVTSDIVSPEIIEGCGLTFKAFDSNDLAKKVIKLLKDEKLKKSLLKNAYNKVLTSYTPEKVVSRILEIYENIL